MNSNWRNRPTTVDYIPKSIDYVISIDESGSPNLKHVLKAKISGNDAAESEKHFTVTACKFPMAHFEQSRDMVMELKRKYWNDALFQYKSGIKRVCFHSREIRGRRDAFNPAIIDYNSFILDLSQLISEMPMTLFASNINKVQHVNQYIYPDSPYDLCMTFVLERIMRDMKEDETCVIILEARGSAEDKELLGQIKRMIDCGTRYHPAHTFSKIKGVYFNPKWCKISDEKKSYWALEIADLCAYPIHKYFVYGTMDKALETIFPKLYSYPNVYGRGLKSFPPNRL